jgi:HAD superfamily hydrolase (TIGR01549 family)
LVEHVVPLDRVTWMVFDLGETLVDETRNWARWADHLGVPHLTFFATLGAVIADRREHTEVFTRFREDFDVGTELVRKAEAGLPWGFTDADLYPDALPALARLRAAGLQLAVMANQPLEAAPFLATLPVDLVATSAEWGVTKPDPEFFARVLAGTGAQAHQVAYVGDRLDNDVLPARAAGMVGVHLRRGPWGHVHRHWPEASQADLSIDSLHELVPSAVIAYDARWPAAFEQERQRLLAILEPWLVADVEHIGSTSVPGLAAKPVIDMVAGVADLDLARQAEEPLASLGYRYRPHRPEALLFDKPGDAPWRQHTHHLHLTVPGSDLWRERLVFRDALRQDPALRREYAEWKLLHASTGDDPYDDTKTPFVTRVLAAAWFGVAPDADRLSRPAPSPAAARGHGRPGRGG